MAGVSPPGPSHGQRNRATDPMDARDTSPEVRHRDNRVRRYGSEAGRGAGAAGQTPTMGVVVESRTDANSTSRLARWFSLGTPLARPLGEWSGRAVRWTLGPRRLRRHLIQPWSLFRVVRHKLARDPGPPAGDARPGLEAA